MDLLGCALHPSCAGKHQGAELASSLTWLSEDGTRFHARSKQLLDGSASVIIRVLNLKKGWTPNLGRQIALSLRSAKLISPIGRQPS